MRGKTKERGHRTHQKHLLVVGHIEFNSVFGHIDFNNYYYSWASLIPQKTFYQTIKVTEYYYMPCQSATQTAG